MNLPILENSSRESDLHLLVTLFFLYQFTLFVFLFLVYQWQNCLVREWPALAKTYPTAYNIFILFVQRVCSLVGEECTSSFNQILARTSFPCPHLVQLSRSMPRDPQKPYWSQAHTSVSHLSFSATFYAGSSITHCTKKAAKRNGHSKGEARNFSAPKITHRSCSKRPDGSIVDISHTYAISFLQPGRRQGFSNVQITLRMLFLLCAQRSHSHPFQ